MMKPCHLSLLIHVEKNAQWIKATMAAKQGQDLCLSVRQRVSMFTELLSQTWIIGVM